MFPDIHISDFTYDLPHERIAHYPLAERDASKLLVSKNNSIEEYRFSDLPGLLPSQTLLVFNNTKVIPARLLFHKDTGATIEIFCLEPNNPADYEQAFAAQGACEWKCVVGNLKRWKNEKLNMLFEGGCLQAEKLHTAADSVAIRFSWDAPVSFAQVLDACGAVPIPPYLQRDAEPNDAKRYQTVYARYRGSVAAPTAGLHFTEQVLEKLKEKNINIAEVTLHVGAGTFRPVKSETITGHTMHSEPFSVTKDTLKLLLTHLADIVAVGTTSARTLESLYWLGCQCLNGIKPERVGQWEPYHSGACPHTPVEEVMQAVTPQAAPQQALEALLAYMERNDLQILHAATQLLIAPSYEYRLVRGLITNFHQPQSTLLLLVAALIGQQWRDVYDYALRNGFRFLSYGDSSLLWNRLR